MKTYTQTRQHARYGDAQGHEFQLDRVTTDQDPWAHYHNTKTQQEYSCRLEAFLARFSPLPE